MPKKGKKGKGKKGKKGKKGQRKEKKESIAALAAANSKVWETRLDIAEQSKEEYRKNARRLLLENDALQNQMYQTERDTIDVVTYLKQQDQEKEAQLERQQQQIRELKKDHHVETEKIVNDFSQKLNELEVKLSEKTREVELMHSELKLVKEFRRKRSQMQKDLEDIKEAMHNAGREHKATLARMEQKFFDEKMRLQQEANQKIAELAGKAHTEAIVNLDETTKSVYKENVRLTEALNYHMKEGEILKKERDKLLEENAILKEEKEVADLMIKEKVAQSRQQKDQIKQLTENVEVLEKALNHFVKEFETEKRAIVKRGETENQAAKVELVKLQRTIELKTREMNKVKKLAKNILDERTELERFFLTSLEEVKAEVAANQEQYRKDANAAYRQKMLAAHVGKGDFPKIRTFNHYENSTNSVFHDIEAAEMLYDTAGKVDISDLTWEQKERVLRYLFAKMNGNKIRRYNLLPSISPKNEPPLSITQGESTVEQKDATGQTFLTQAHIDMVNQFQSLNQSESQAFIDMGNQFPSLNQSESQPA
ncbi:basal body-orientation factor 1-like isoform X2 [Biomphalaria pfeifferi]|uniref:Basal body-orientation factor 1 n=1 Tax=Biomphalaria pfeifferi TaxID=112525 RepID=A0AAD8B2I9_BIOPF|nr:basal body-orientation factor 1-like isoform X2 [Biomphalaria pfeifferi]